MLTFEERMKRTESDVRFFFTSAGFCCLHRSHANKLNIKRIFNKSERKRWKIMSTEKIQQKKQKKMKKSTIHKRTKNKKKNQIMKNNSRHKQRTGTKARQWQITAKRKNENANTSRINTKKMWNKQMKFYVDVHRLLFVCHHQFTCHALTLNR